MYLDTHIFLFLAFLKFFIFIVFTLLYLMYCNVFNLFISDHKELFNFFLGFSFRKISNIKTEKVNNHVCHLYVTVANILPYLLHLFFYC